MGYLFFTLTHQHPTPYFALAVMKKSNVLGKQPVLCWFKLIDQRAAIELSLVSEFLHENEVLIVPWLAFKAQGVHRITVTIQIDLEQL